MTAQTDDDLDTLSTDPPERVKGELVQQAPSDVEQRNRQVEALADQALQLPTLPGRDEFLALAMQARILSMSAGAPPAVRNNPHLAFHLAMIGRDLGISPTASLQLVDVIGYDPKNPNNYDKVQLSLSPELLDGQVRRMGLGRIVPGLREKHRAVAVALEPGGKLDPRCRPTLPTHHDECKCVGYMGETEFTWEDAQGAELAGPECQPGEHKKERKSSNGRSWETCPCRQGYRTYPQRMLWWRASGWCQSDYFPEASIGLYSPEELGAVVDENGRPIDPATIELPEGYAPKELPPDPADDLLSEAEDGTDLAKVREEIKERVAAIKASKPAAEALSALWTELHDDGSMKTPPLPHLRRRHLPRVKAMLGSIEARIKRGEWAQTAAEPAPPPDEQAEEVAGPKFSQAFAIKAGEVGLDAERRHAVIAHATNGRTRTSKEVLKSEVANCYTVLEHVRDRRFIFTEGEDGALNLTDAPAEAPRAPVERSGAIDTTATPVEPSPAASDEGAPSPEQVAYTIVVASLRSMLEDIPEPKRKTVALQLRAQRIDLDRDDLTEEQMDQAERIIWDAATAT